MTIDEAIYCAGGEIINDASDERYSEDGDNVIFGEKRYWYESIDLVYMPESQKKLTSSKKSRPKGRLFYYQISHSFSGSGLRDNVLKSFQRGGQKMSFVPPAKNGTKKYSSQISLVISLIPTLRPISLRLMKNGSKEGLIR